MSICNRVLTTATLGSTASKKKNNRKKKGANKNKDPLPISNGHLNHEDEHRDNDDDSEIVCP
jgi:hypothetical protein